MFHGYYLLYQVIYVHLLTFSEIVSAIIDHFKHVLALFATPFTVILLSLKCGSFLFP